jgi:hypothetical protein
MRNSGVLGDFSELSSESSSELPSGEFAMRKWGETHDGAEATQYR